MKSISLFIIIMVLLGGLVLLLLKYFPETLSSDQNKVSLISLVVMLSFVFTRMSRSSSSVTMFLKQLGSWLVITLIMITGYSYQMEIKQYTARLAANIIPGYGQENRDGSVTYYAGENGHFIITALLNNSAKVKFLFDTGASTISLTKKDAERIGIDTKALNYNVPLNTANGMSWGARVTIARIQVGDIVITDVAGTVSQSGLDTSLLGMSFLGQLQKFVIKGNVLTLTN